MNIIKKASLKGLNGREDGAGGNNTPSPRLPDTLRRARSRSPRFSWVEGKFTAQRYTWTKYLSGHPETSQFVDMECRTTIARDNLSPHRRELTRTVDVVAVYPFGVHYIFPSGSGER